MQLSTPAFLFSGLLSLCLFIFGFLLLLPLSLCPSLYILISLSSVSGSTTFSVSSPFFCDSLFCCLWFWRLVAEDCEDDGQCWFSSLRFRPLVWACVSYAPGFYILSPSVLRWRDKDDGGAGDVCSAEMAGQGWCGGGFGLKPKRKRKATKGFSGCFWWPGKKRRKIKLGGGGSGGYSRIRPRPKLTNHTFHRNKSLIFLFYILNHVKIKLKANGPKLGYDSSE